jgi:PKD repeat protein
VQFDASGSSDADSIDTISKYTFNFGDGSDDVNQSTPMITHTFTDAGEYIVRLVVTDSRGKVSSNTAQFKVDVERPAPTPTPTPIYIEDNDSRVSYSGGWHLADYSGATAGHIRYHSGSNAQHFARLDFSVPANNVGAITYSFAKSKKGGAADVYLDGVLKERINYGSSTGSTQSPDVMPEYKVTYGNLAAGTHRLEIKNMSGVVYVDRFVLENSTSNAQPATGPGTTTNQPGNAAAGQTASSNYQPQQGSQEFTVFVESSVDVPFKLIVVDPAGLSVATADSSQGMAVLNVPVSAGGMYVVRVVNVSLGPLQFTTTVTPLVTR